MLVPDPVPAQMKLWFPIIKAYVLGLCESLKLCFDTKHSGKILMKIFETGGEKDVTHLKVKVQVF